MRIIFVFIGGGTGAAARYWMQGAVHDVVGASFPYGTLSVNLLGAFLIGFLMTVFEARFLVQPDLRIFLTIGVLGGFTTFSSFSFETLMLIQEGSITAGIMNALVSVTGCLAATWLGTVAGKLL